MKVCRVQSKALMGFSCAAVLAQRSGRNRCLAQQAAESVLRDARVFFARCLKTKTNRLRSRHPFLSSDGRNTCFLASKNTILRIVVFGRRSTRVSRVFSPFAGRGLQLAARLPALVVQQTKWSFI